MRIFLIRHGFSEGNEDLSKYETKGDVHIELTDLGWQQAVAAGQFLAKYFKNNPPGFGTVRTCGHAKHHRA